MAKLLLQQKDPWTEPDSGRMQPEAGLEPTSCYFFASSAGCTARDPGPPKQSLAALSLLVTLRPALGDSSLEASPCSQPLGAVSSADSISAKASPEASRHDTLLLNHEVCIYFKLSQKVKLGLGTLATLQTILLLRLHDLILWSQKPAEITMRGLMRSFDDGEHDSDPVLFRESCCPRDVNAGFPWRPCLVLTLHSVDSHDDTEGWSPSEPDQRMRSRTFNPIICRM